MDSGQLIWLSYKLLFKTICLWIMDIARRFAENPLLQPKDIRPSREGLQVISLLNPGVFRYEGKT